jgi:ATP-dependent exoDNAse (exonuclease V) alpha subunit
MAIFHLSAKVVSRGKGQSAVAKAAYNAREKLEQEFTGKVNDFSRKQGLEFSGIFAPENAPDWARDREQLWNEVEKFEKRKDAQLAREVEVSLPHELNAEQRKQLITDFVREQFMRPGMVADVNIHAPDRKGDDRNYHAHILLTMREIGPDGFGPKVREWNGREQLEKWREGWERTANRYLERHGFEPTLDRRTLEAQGIDREPTKHRGVHAQGMERRGLDTERGNAYRDTVERNAELRTLKAELREVSEELDEEQKRRAGRWIDGPDSGGRVAQEAYAMEQARKAEESREQKQEGRQREDGDRKLTEDRRREEAQLNPSSLKSDREEPIDFVRFSLDEGYRKEMTARAAQQIEAERSQTDRSPEQDRGRERDRS